MFDPLDLTYSNNNAASGQKLFPPNFLIGTQLIAAAIVCVLPQYYMNLNLNENSFIIHKCKFLQFRRQ